MAVTMTTLVAGAISGESLIAFPTDTVPALASRPDCAALIYAAKQRPPDKPLILMAATAVELWAFTTGTEAERRVWQRVAEQHWPGALTLVLPANDRLPPAVNPLNPTTIGLRIPNHPLALEVLAQTGPLATTSVNRSGDPPLETISEIEAQFPQVLTLLLTELDDSVETKPTGVPSTVAQWVGDRWQILRQGAVMLKPQIK